MLFEHLTKRDPHAHITTHVNSPSALDCAAVAKRRAGTTTSNDRSTAEIVSDSSLSAT
jgi:hypothetical protein